jgi:hypothetical protein
VSEAEEIRRELARLANQPEITGNDDVEKLFESAIRAGLDGKLPMFRVEAIVQHLVQHDWLLERGYVPGPEPARMPAERPPELVAEQERIAERWRELSAQVRAGNPPNTDWIGLSEADRQLINQLHGYRPKAEREAESC